MMANLLRTAKSGSNWGQIDLHSYNIAIEFQDATTFFGVDPLPPPAVDAELLNNVAADDMVNDANYKLVRYMDLATDPVPSDASESESESESAVVDFAIHLLTSLGYAPRARMVRTRTPIPFTICGQERHATPDVCIVDPEDALSLLVQAAGKRLRHRDAQTDEASASRSALTNPEPEPQLVAKAIAAFQATNDRRTRVLGREPIAHAVVPGMTLDGTSPVFCKIPVTARLARCVALGIYPDTPTVVHAHLPAVARPARRLSEGMKPLDNRATIFACYEAFKRFVE